MAIRRGHIFSMRNFLPDDTVKKSMGYIYSYCFAFVLFKSVPSERLCMTCTVFSHLIPSRKLCDTETLLRTVSLKE